MILGPSRAFRKRALRLSLLAALAAACATVTGTVTGPVSGPLHVYEARWCAPPWFMPLAYVISVPLGVVMGMTTGVAADVGFVLSGGEYGVSGYPRFSDIFHPTTAEWGHYQPVDAQVGHREPGFDGSR
ncbi:MAG: hypothetical protein WAT39_18425 [Planctomycetota bacterium]